MLFRFSPINGFPLALLLSGSEGHPVNSQQHESMGRLRLLRRMVFPVVAVGVL
jgi:hypothetical protein